MLCAILCRGQYRRRPTTDIVIGSDSLLSYLTVVGKCVASLSTNAFCLFLGNDALVLDEDLIFLFHLMLFIIVIVLADERLFDLLLSDHPQIITELNLVDLVVLLFRLRSLLTVRVGLIFLPTLTH